MEYCRKRLFPSTDMVNTVNKKELPIAPFFTGFHGVAVRLNKHLPIHCQRRGHRLTTVDQSDMRGLGTE